MSMRKTARVAVLSAGMAATIGGGVAPVANAAPPVGIETGAVAAAATPAAIPAVAARGRRIVRDATWERAVLKQVNALRKKQHMRNVTANTCLSNAVRPVALRTAKTRRIATWGKADTRRLQKCVPARHRLAGRVVWGPSGRTASSWVTASLKQFGGTFDKRATLAGIAVYRDSAGRHWIVMSQMFTRKG